MSNTQKFTKEELDEIQKLREENARSINEFGNIELEILLTNQKLDLLKQAKETTTESYKKLQEQERLFVQKLNEKYGTGTVDISNGEFTPSKCLFDNLFRYL
jgi:hypothetical protein